MINNTFFKDIDTPYKCYLYGLILFNIKENVINNNNLKIEITIDYLFDIKTNMKLSYYDYKSQYINDKNLYIYYRNIDILIDNLHEIGDVKYDNYNNIVLIISSNTIIKDIYKHINNKSLNNLYQTDLSELFEISNNFALAYIERFGNIISDNLYITFYNVNNMNKFTNLYNIPHTINKHLNFFTIIFENVNMIDLLGLINNKNHFAYINNSIFNFNNKDGNSVVQSLKVFKDVEEAVIPSKSSYSDAGFDITIIKEHKRLNSDTVLYDTGIKLDIPNGYYVEIVPRSSISRSGYMLANNVGIIDQGYRGNIFIALRKINKDCDDLVMPWKCCQMLIKKQLYCNLVISSTEASTSHRGIGGFGSTDTIV